MLAITLGWHNAFIKRPPPAFGKPEFCWRQRATAAGTMLWWVNLDALDLPGVVRQQRLERHQIVALHDEIAAAVIAARQFRHVLEQPKRNLVVMIHHGFFSNPVQCRHEISRIVIQRAPPGNANAKFAAEEACQAVGKGADISFVVRGDN